MSDSSQHSAKKIDEKELPEIPQLGCGILGRHPVLSVLCFALVGIGIGVGLSYWEDDGDTKEKVVKWIGLFGDLFIRALKCVILPLVFINVALSVIEMMEIGRAGSIGWKTIGLYLFTTVVASIFGILSVVSFKGLFEAYTFEDPVPATIKLGCNNPDTFLTEMADGSVVCSADMEGSSEFYIDDITGSFVKSTAKVRSDVSLSDTVYEGIFTKTVTDNIVFAFGQSNFVAVVFFALVFGLAASKALAKRGCGSSESFLIVFLKELEVVFLILINWIISCTPFAVMSLITAAVGSQSDIAASFSNVAYLVGATLVAMSVHYVLMYCLFFWLMTKWNPFEYHRHLVPAQTMAFACASSAATIPMSLRCMQSTGRVPSHIARFVIPLGATVNMDGGAIYFPCACIWLAVLNGIEPDMSSYFLLVIIATIGSIGTAPVPSASLVLIITAYNTVFNATGVPEGFSFILAIDWFMDRCRTVMNVTGDMVCSGIVSHLCTDEESIELEETTDNKAECAEIDSRCTGTDSE